MAKPKDQSDDQYDFHIYDVQLAALGHPATIKRRVSLTVAASEIGDAMRLHGHEKTVQLADAVKVHTKQFREDREREGSIPHRLIFTVKGVTVSELRNAFRKTKRERNE